MDGYAGRNKTLIINCGAKAYSTTTTQPTVDCHSVLSIILTNGSSWNRAPIPSPVTATTNGTNPVVTFSFSDRGNEQHGLGQCRIVEWHSPGIGPLELLSFSHTKRLDRAGSVSFAISGVMGRTYLIQPRRYIRAFGMVGDSATPDVTGLALASWTASRSIATTPSVEGDDLMRELCKSQRPRPVPFDDYVRIADESRYGAANDYIERMTDDDPAHHH